MKVSAIPMVLAATAGLVSTAPVIVVYTTKPQAPDSQVAPAWAQSIRWGHAAAPAFNLPPLEPASSQAAGKPIKSTLTWLHFGERPSKFMDPASARRKGGCRMKAMQNKSLQWGNKLRVILGLSPIEKFHPDHGVETLVDGNGKVIYRKEIPVHRPLMHRHHHHSRPLHRRPFMLRLAEALASLGPWEGRAVSFVLGCGLGVLLRMFFVFGVLLVRFVRARRQEGQVSLEEDLVVFVADVKEPAAVETLPAYAEKVDVEPEQAQTNIAH